MQDITALKALIPALAGLPARPKRVVLHWTGGGPTANDIDKAHYHFIVNRDGTVVRGAHTVAQNMKQLSARDSYAGHTGGFNSFSIGVSFAGMADSGPVTAKHPKGVFGPYPLTEAQVRAGLIFVALLCKTYGLDPKNVNHVFTHYEAWTVHKVKGQMNDQKFDITMLQFMPSLGKDQVGPWLRENAALHLKELA